MQFVNIEQTDHALIRSRADEVELPIAEGIKDVVKEMQVTFNKISPASGLAAPQIGVGYRIIIVNIPDIALQYRKDVTKTMPPTIYINPSYTPVREHGLTKDWEGCYSVPNAMGEVHRYNSIDFQGFTPDGANHAGRISGFLARVIQHEVDHLNGILYIDKLNKDCRFGPMDEMMVIRKKELGLD